MYSQGEHSPCLATASCGWRELREGGGTGSDGFWLGGGTDRRFRHELDHGQDGGAVVAELEGDVGLAFVQSDELGRDEVARRHVERRLGLVAEADAQGRTSIATPEEAPHPVHGLVVRLVRHEVRVGRDFGEHRSHGRLGRQLGLVPRAALDALEADLEAQAIVGAGVGRPGDHPGGDERPRQAAVAVGGEAEPAGEQGEQLLVVLGDRFAQHGALTGQGPGLVWTILDGEGVTHEHAAAGHFGGDDELGGVVDL